MQHKRIYVATSTKNVELARELKQAIRSLPGREVTHDWTGTDHIFDTSLDEGDDAFAKKIAAINDLRGVRTADLLIYLGHDLCFGANIELGAALAYGIEVWVVGPVRGSVFFELDQVTVMNFGQMLGRLGLQWEVTP